MRAMTDSMVVEFDRKKIQSNSRNKKASTRIIGSCRPIVLSSHESMVGEDFLKNIIFVEHLFQ